MKKCGGVNIRCRLLLHMPLILDDPPEDHIWPPLKLELDLNVEEGGECDSDPNSND